MSQSTNSIRAALLTAAAELGIDLPEQQISDFARAIKDLELSFVLTVLSSRRLGPEETVAFLSDRWGIPNPLQSKESPCSKQ